VRENEDVIEGCGDGGFLTNGLRGSAQNPPKGEQGVDTDQDGSRRQASTDLASVVMGTLEGNMFDALAVWMSHQRDRAGLGLSTNDAFDQLARDLGIGADELSAVMSSVPDRGPLQLPEMLKALGIDEASLGRVQPALLRTLQRRCAQCEVGARCRHSLDRNVATQDYAQYCPNAAALTAFRPMHEGRPFG
jgi:hypothetical protein